MQVFRPYAENHKTARLLDPKRLGKQRIETKQVCYAILRKAGALRDGRRGWLNHPIVCRYYNLGRAYFHDLHLYFLAINTEWVRRGYRSSINWDDLEEYCGLFGQEAYPLSHAEEVEYRRVLVFKNPEWYARRLSAAELEEVLETPPVYIRGVNAAVFDHPEGYRLLVEKIRREFGFPPRP